MRLGAGGASDGPAGEGRGPSVGDCCGDAAPVPAPAPDAAGGGGINGGVDCAPTPEPAPAPEAEPGPVAAANASAAEPRSNCIRFAEGELCGEFELRMAMDDRCCKKRFGFSSSTPSSPPDDTERRGAGSVTGEGSLVPSLGDPEPWGDAVEGDPVLTLSADNGDNTGVVFAATGAMEGGDTGRLSSDGW